VLSILQGWIEGKRAVFVLSEKKKTALRLKIFPQTRHNIFQSPRGVSAKQHHCDIIFYKHSGLRHYDRFAFLEPLLGILDMLPI